VDVDEELLLRATIAEIAASADGDELTEALDRFGWQEMLTADPGTAIPAVFEGQGEKGKWSSALHDVLGSTLGLEPDTAALIPLPGETRTAHSGPSGLTVKGMMLSQRPDLTKVLASAKGADRSLTLVTVPMSTLTVERVDGLDPTISASVAVGHITAGEIVEELDDESEWDDAVADGRLALSHQLVGTMVAMESLALTHALERSQFGRQIGSFQAVRHRLAETRVAIEAARAAAGAAAPTRACSPADRTDGQLASSLAKMIAGRSAIKVAANCQQVLAGIGFTSEHPFQRFMKRAMVLERMLGDTGSLAHAIGRQLVTQGAAPRVVDL
jgi:hypothetical protein